MISKLYNNHKKKAAPLTFNISVHLIVYPVSSCLLPDQQKIDLSPSRLTQHRQTRLLSGILDNWRTNRGAINYQQTQRCHKCHLSSDPPNDHHHHLGKEAQ